MIQDGSAFFISFMYLLLAVGLAVYGWKLLYLVGVKNVKLPFLKSKYHISVITISLFIVFTSRSIKDFLSGVHIGDIPIDDDTSKRLPTQILLVSLMIVWEIVPACMVIFLFWRIPDSRAVPLNTAPVPYYSEFGNMGSGSSSNATSLDITGISVEEHAPVPTQYATLFANPDRYETDNEVTPENSLARRTTLPMQLAANSYSPGDSSSLSPARPKRIVGKFASLQPYSTRSPLLGLEVPGENS